MITVIAYRYRKGNLDQTTWSTNMASLKDMRGIGVGTAVWRPATLVVEQKRVGVKVNTG